MSVLGMVEFSAIAAGIRGSDAMVKAAPVELIESRPITPGKYMSLVTGDLASVEASVRAGVAAAGDEGVVEHFVLANLHEQVLPVLLGKGPQHAIESVGVIETISAAAIVEAADAACKAAPVVLVQLHLANHIGGKGYLTITGTVADVEAGVAAGAQVAEGQVLDRLILANPYPELNAYLVKRHSW
jgi:microcompartment protein CcmL/EutN